LTDAPLIGISTYRQPADWRGWTGVAADLLPRAYADSVVAAGGVPVLIPPVMDDEAADRLVSRLDGLIIAGGADINPARYGAEPVAEVTVWYDDRDASELRLLDAADRAALPVLGICRGMQLMAVHTGGKLIQHLPSVVGHPRHGGGDGEYGEVTVTSTGTGRVSEAVDAEFVAACHHHQAVATHPGFVAVAQDEDGIVQAIEAPGDRFAVAVQWHPETLPDKRLFGALIAAAAAPRA
jgi:putative glutamine amidotransferase